MQIRLDARGDAEVGIELGFFAEADGGAELGDADLGTLCRRRDAVGEGAALPEGIADSVTIGGNLFIAAVAEDIEVRREDAEPALDNNGPHVRGVCSQTDDPALASKTDRVDLS